MYACVRMRVCPFIFHSTVDLLFFFFFFFPPFFLIFKEQHHRGWLRSPRGFVIMGYLLRDLWEMTSGVLEVHT